MIHAFDTDLAELVGVDAALIYYHFEYYCQLKEQTGLDIYEGRAWTYSSLSELQEKHPYMSVYAIRQAVKTLLDKKLILRRNDLNKVGYDRTYWYAVCEYQHTDLSKTTDRFAETVTPICRNQHTDLSKTTQGGVEINTRVCGFQHNNTNTTTNTTTNTIKKETKAKKDTFKPPTLEQVREYCQDKGYTINPETFIDYYTSNGWHVGKNKMRDWRAAVRTWVNKDKDRKPKSKSLPFDQFLEGEEVSFK